MQKLNLNVSYNIKYPEGTGPADITHAQSELTKSYIEFAVTSGFKSGLAGQARRVYSRIVKKIDKAIEDKVYEVELEDPEIKFIKSAFESEDCKFSAPIAQYVVVLEDEIFGSSNK